MQLSHLQGFAKYPSSGATCIRLLLHRVYRDNASFVSRHTTTEGCTLTDQLLQRSMARYEPEMLVDEAASTLASDQSIREFAERHWLCTVVSMHPPHDSM